MGRDLVPRQVDEYTLWMECFTQALEEAGDTVGVAAAELEQLQADVISLRQLISRQIELQAAARAATTERDAFCRHTRQRTAMLARRLKQHPRYSPQLGQRLGIEHAPTPLAPGELELLQPKLHCSVVGGGKVLVAFEKGRLSGILLYCRRSEQEKFTLLAKQLRSPCIDHRPVLYDGVPEVRQYQAQYFLGDDPAGQFSDTARVVVPG